MIIHTFINYVIVVDIPSLVYRSAGVGGVIQEVEMDIKRLAKRNLGRDDRYHTEGPDTRMHSFTATTFSETCCTCACLPVHNDICGIPLYLYKVYIYRNRDE